MDRNEWYEYFASLRQGMTLAFQVEQRSSLRDSYIGKIDGTLNTRRYGLERWVVQLQVHDFVDGATKTAYIYSYLYGSEYIKKFYFRDNPHWYPNILQLIVV